MLALGAETTGFSATTLLIVRQARTERRRSRRRRRRPRTAGVARGSVVAPMGCSSSVPAAASKPSAAAAQPLKDSSPHPTPQPLSPAFQDNNNVQSQQQQQHLSKRFTPPVSPSRSSKPSPRTPSPAHPVVVVVAESPPVDKSSPVSSADAAASSPPAIVIAAAPPQPPPTFAALTDVLHVVATFLASGDVVALMCCSRTVHHRLADDEALWTRIVLDAIARDVPVRDAHALLARFPALGTLSDAATAQWVEIDFAMSDAYLTRLCELLRDNASLQTLQISHAGLTDSHLANLASALAAQGQVTFIDVSNNPHVDHSVLLQVPSLKALSLSRNEIGDEGVRSLAIALKSHGTLDTLILRENAIGDKGCEHLNNVLESSEKLTSLDLADNHISDMGALLIKQMCKRHASLTKVNLEENNISRSVLAEMGRGYVQPTVYTREKSKDFTD